MIDLKVNVISGDLQSLTECINFERS